MAGMGGPHSWKYLRYKSRWHVHSKELSKRVQHQNVLIMCNMIQKCGLYRGLSGKFTLETWTVLKHGIVLKCGLTERDPATFFSLYPHLTHAHAHGRWKCLSEHWFYIYWSMKIFFAGFGERHFREDFQGAEAAAGGHVWGIFLNCYYLFLFYHLYPFIIYNSPMHIFSLWSALSIYTRR
jgi:hypothetical protein